MLRCFLKRFRRWWRFLVYCGTVCGVTLKAVANLLRTVNCYYSNLIEDHDTRPVDIEKAMKSEYSLDTKKRDMRKMLEIDSFADRIKAYGVGRQNGFLPDRNGNVDRNSHFRKEMTHLLHQLVYRGSISRGEIPELLGLEERTARRVVRFLADEGFVVSKSSKAPLCIAIPAHAAPYIFPGLF